MKPFSRCAIEADGLLAVAIFRTYRNSGKKLWVCDTPGRKNNYLCRSLPAASMPF